MCVRKYDRVEALARAAELDAGVRHAMCARGEALIDPRHVAALVASAPRPAAWVVVYAQHGARHEVPVECAETARRAVDLLRKEGLTAWRELRR